VADQISDQTGTEAEVEFSPTFSCIRGYLQIQGKYPIKEDVADKWGVADESRGPPGNAGPPALR